MIKQIINTESLIKILFIFAIGFATCGFVLSLHLSERVSSFLNGETIEEENIQNFSECENMPVENTSYCLRDFVEPYYNHNLNYQSKPNRSIQDILENGGSCMHYASLYVQMGEILGFKGDFLIHDAIYEGNKKIISSHKWAVLWDNETRCEISNLNVCCDKIE